MIRVAWAFLNFPATAGGSRSTLRMTLQKRSGWQMVAQQML